MNKNKYFLSLIYLSHFKIIRVFFERLQSFENPEELKMLNIVLLLVFPLFFVLSNGSVSMHNPFYCYSEDSIRPQMGMFSTKTAYETSRGQSINASVSSCTPSKFWFVSRHGTRLPSTADLRNIFEYNEILHSDILSNYDSGRTSLCSSDIELIKNWYFDPNITLENEQHLTHSGQNC